MNFFRGAQKLSIALHKSNPEIYQTEQAIDPERLKDWSSRHGFMPRLEKTLSLRVAVNVRGSTSLTREQQERRGWNDVALPDLAVAHSAFYLLTGKDLFEGKIVRASKNALFFYETGLDVNSSPDDRRSSLVSASSSLPNPN